MANIVNQKKSVAVNPIKLSQPLGAALAFLGLKGTMPLFHGSQGCTAFAKVLLVRHFREAIPMSTTAMTEVTTILGGEENIEKAILTLVEKSKPEMIGLLTTGLTETRGDDMDGILKTIRKRRPELNDLPIIFVSTPDFKGSLQDGYAAAVESIVTSIPDQPPVALNPKQITILAGSMLTPGDIQELKEIVASFGLTPIVVPDISGSLDGHLTDGEFSSTTTGGTTLAELKKLGQSCFTLAIAESMRGAANILQERFSTPFEVFPRLVGLGVMDQFLMRLSELTQVPVPDKYRHQRRQLQDAMLDTHFYFGRKQIALALEPDQLFSTSQWLTEMGCQIQAAITTTKSPILSKIPVDNVIVGDLEDLELLAIGSDLIIANSKGATLSKKLGIPLYRQGLPIFDRLGNGLKCSIGYRGTIEILFEIGNIFLEYEESHAGKFNYD